MGRPEEQETYKSKLFNFKGMFDLPGRHAKSLSAESATILDPHVLKSDKFGTPDKEETGTPGSMTLLDFMGWESEQGDSDMVKKESQVSEDFFKELDAKYQKLPSVAINKVSYLENLGGVRSPASRH